MASIVVGIYPSISKAQSAVSALIRSGFAWETVSVVLGTSTLVDCNTFVAAEQCEPTVALDENNGRMVVLAAGFLAAGPLAELLHRTGSRSGERALSALLTAAGMRAPVVVYLKDALDDGAILVAVQCDDRRAEDARGILRNPAASRRDVVASVDGRDRPDGLRSFATIWPYEGKMTLQ
jgi:hypothetical protein